MSELRQDRTTGDRVLIAPQRGKRWQAQFGFLRQELSSQPSGLYNPHCPFCPGNEVELPGIVEELPMDAPPGWRVRIVPNRYPAIDWGLDRARSDRDPTTIEGNGSHEVVIESPWHNADLTSISDADVAAIFSVARRRCAELLAHPSTQAVILYRNSGRLSGATIQHPHAQLMALGVVPPRLERVSRWARQYYHDHARCVICDVLRHEQENGSRIIDETATFASWVPFAATVPFEIWIVPKTHQASFVDMDGAESINLGFLMRRVLRRLDAVHGVRVPYNYAVDSACRSDISAPHFHWRMRIAPCTVAWGGFELATRMPINPSSPEQDAAVLRAANYNAIG